MSGAVLTPKNPEGLRDLPFEVPKVTAAQKKRAREIYAALEARYPDAHCELEYRTPFELLVATILSAQATDVGVNKATPALFAKYPDAKAMAKAEPEEIEPLVRSLGFFRSKSKSIVEASRSIVSEFGGEVPRTMDELLRLRGVARKTANVVLGNAYGINAGVCVDTHVQRLSERFGLAPAGSDAVKTEKYLAALFPRDCWCMLSHLLISHGRAVCKARGGTCAEDPICRKYCSNAKAGAKPAKKKATKKTVKKASARKKAGKKKRTKKTSKKRARSRE